MFLIVDSCVRVGAEYPEALKFTKVVTSLLIDKLSQIPRPH